MLARGVTADSGMIALTLRLRALMKNDDQPLDQAMDQLLLCINGDENPSMH